MKIKSFKAIRPVPAEVAKIASRPYDVLNSEEARVEAKGNPLSFLNIVKREAKNMMPAAIPPKNK